MQAAELIKTAPVDQGADAVIIWAFVVMLVVGGLAVASVAIWAANRLVPSVLSRFDKLIETMSTGFSKVESTVRMDGQERREEFKAWIREHDKELAEIKERQTRTLIILEEISPSGKLKSDAIMGRQP